jgi:hypothetical protein
MTTICTIDSSTKRRDSFPHTRPSPIGGWFLTGAGLRPYQGSSNTLARRDTWSFPSGRVRCVRRHALRRDLNALIAHFIFRIAPIMLTAVAEMTVCANPIFAQSARAATSTCMQPGGQGAQIVPTGTFELLPHSTLRTLVNPLNPGDTSHLTVLSFGDSAMWGNGLDNDHKYSHKVAQHIADATQRTVNLVTYSHSGANLSTEDGQSYEPLKSSDKGTPPGDPNAGLPTTLQQEACAAAVPAHRAAEIILLDGCINDVSAFKIALPFPFSGATVDEIRHRSHQQCSDKMLDLLNNAKADFPKATIIVSNYWRIISDKSSPFGVAIARSEAQSTPSDRAAKLEFLSLLEVQRKAERLTGQNFIGTDVLADPRVTFQKWSANSAVFLETSQTCFEWAISVVDGKASSSSSSHNDQHGTGKADRCPDANKVDPQLVTQDLRVFLATVPDNPDFAYGAGRRKHLWSVPVGPFRHDQMFGRRLVLCNTHYPIGGERFICTVNATAHPNVPGAEAFIASIGTIIDAAWKAQ